jgi:hypothetical protein
MPTLTTMTTTSYTTTTGSPVAITVTSGTIAAALTTLGVSGFTAQVQLGLCIAALAILYPNAEDPTVPNFDKRQRYSRQVLVNSSYIAPIASFLVASDGVTGIVPGTSTDQQLINRILAIYDELSFSGIP